MYPRKQNLTHSKWFRILLLWYKSLIFTYLFVYELYGRFRIILLSHKAQVQFLTSSLVFIAMRKWKWKYNALVFVAMKKKKRCCGTLLINRWCGDVALCQVVHESMQTWKQTSRDKEVELILLYCLLSLLNKQFFPGSFCRNRLCLLSLHSFCLR